MTRIGPNNDSNGKSFRLSESDQHREVGVKRDLLPASNAERGKGLRSGVVSVWSAELRYYGNTFKAASRVNPGKTVTNSRQRRFTAL